MTTSEKVRKILEAGHLAIVSSGDDKVHLHFYSLGSFWPESGNLLGDKDIDMYRLDEVILRKPKMYEVGQLVKFQNELFCITSMNDTIFTYDLSHRGKEPSENYVLSNISHFHVEPVFNEEVEEDKVDSIDDRAIEKAEKLRNIMKEFTRELKQVLDDKTKEQE